MSSISIDIDLDIYDIISSMSTDQKQEFANALYEECYVADEIENLIGNLENLIGNPNLYDEWDNSITKLIGNQCRLSAEDADTILRIINKNIT